MKNNLIPNIQKIGNYSFDSNKTTPVSSLYQQQSKSKDKILLTDDYKQVIRNSDGSYRYYDPNDKTSKIESNTKKEPTLYNSVVNKLNELNLNPKNWRVRDLSNFKTRGEAFNAARNDGEKEFMYKGARYNTNYAGTSEQQLKETGLTNEQLQNRSPLNKNLTKNLFPFGYNNITSRLINAGIKNNKETLRNIYDNKGVITKETNKYDYNFNIHNNFTEWMKDPKTFKQINNRLDALNLYSGIPQKNNTFKISDYRPSTAKNKNANYYSFNNNNDVIADRIVSYANSTLDKWAGTDIPVGTEYLLLDGLDDKAVMGTYKVSAGKDKKGNYLSYYDIWDLSPANFGKPFEIYDRVYTKDYGKDKGHIISQLQRMYYSDDELSKLNPDKKNFDTLALQRELTNRGYSLPKSAKSDGTLDGILGEETKQALLDYQSKNKKMYGGKLLPSINKL